MEFQVLELRQDISGQHHPEFLWTTHSLAMTWYALEQYDEAEKLMEDVSELRKEVVGETNRFPLGSKETLGSWQEERRLREAQGAEASQADFTAHLLWLVCEK